MSTIKVNTIQTVAGTDAVLVSDIAKSSDLGGSSGAALIGYVPTSTAPTVTAENLAVGVRYIVITPGIPSLGAVGSNFAATGLETGTGTARVYLTVHDKLRESVSVKDFGAVGDGEADDTTKIQAAIDSGKNIYFPSGRYLITSTLTVSTRGQGFYGDSGSIGGKSDITTNDFGTILQFSKSTATDSTPMILVTRSQVSFSNLKFVGDAGSTSDIGIKCQASTNTDDMDGYIYDCDFNQFTKSIYFYGRALHADKCVFAGFGGGVSITLDWDASNEIGGDLNINNLYKGRAHRITNNRHHGGGGLFVEIKNYIQRSPIYSGNTIDIGNEFIRVAAGAGLNGAVIDGNVADLCGSSPINFKGLSYCRNVVISNNRLGGSIVDLIDGDGTRPYAAVSFDGVAEINGLLINGNTLSGTSAGGVAIINDAAKPLITVTNISITNNLINYVGVDGVASRFVFYTAFDVNGLIFSNNNISSLGATVVSLIRSASKTITNVVIKGNIYDTAVPVLTTTTLAGTLDTALTTDGTYTPIQVSTNSSNVNSVTHYSAQYMRVGDVVMVSGAISITTNSTGDTQVRFSLPVPSALVASYHCAGVATQNGASAIPSVIGSIFADDAYNCAALRLASATVATVAYVYHFSYRVI